MIGFSSAEKRQVKTTYSGFLMRSPFSEARKTSISFERTFARRQGLLQEKRHLRGEKGSLVKETGAIYPLRLDHVKLHEILQLFRLNPKNRARLLQFQGSLCYIPSITI